MMKKKLIEECKKLYIKRNKLLGIIKNFRKVMDQALNNIFEIFVKKKFFFVFS